MIYDRLSDLSLLPPLFLLFSGNGASLAGTPASSRGFRNVPLARGGFRSEWVTARDGVLYSHAVTREFITHYDREGTRAKSGRDAFRIRALLPPLPVDFSSVINFQTPHRRL